MYHCKQTLLSMKIQEVAIKPMFGMLQEQETQAKKNGERKGLKKKKSQVR